MERTVKNPQLKPDDKPVNLSGGRAGSQTCGQTGARDQLRPATKSFAFSDRQEDYRWPPFVKQNPVLFSQLRRGVRASSRPPPPPQLAPDKTRRRGAAETAAVPRAEHLGLLVEAVKRQDRRRRCSVRSGLKSGRVEHKQRRLPRNSSRLRCTPFPSPARERPSCQTASRARLPRPSRVPGSRGSSPARFIRGSDLRDNSRGLRSVIRALCGPPPPPPGLTLGLSSDAHALRGTCRARPRPLLSLSLLLSLTPLPSVFPFRSGCSRRTFTASGTARRCYVLSLSLSPHLISLYPSLSLLLCQHAAL